MMRALWLKFLASSSFLLAADCVAVSLDAQSCEADFSSTEASLSLLQLNSERKLAQSQKQGPVKKQGGQHSVAGAARAALPKHLYRLGLKLLRTEEILDAVVANTREETSLYAWEAVTFRIPIGDQVDSGDNYGLDSLGSEKLSESGMMNMLDIGGNLGRVSIAAFKKYPELMRIVVVEPVPATFFLLSWNLWLNKIPQLSLSEFRASPRLPGVVALNNGVASLDRQTDCIGWTPPFTMGSRQCNCSNQQETELPQAWQKQCLPMLSRKIDYFLNIFGNQKITFLKMDCEGCEIAAIPSLENLLPTSRHRIVRFGGELHEGRNELEDFACQFEGGSWFMQVCFVQRKKSEGGDTYKTFRLSDRCQRGADRESCNRKVLWGMA
mmetsp:Transcript_113778/g.207008  ORF Transcript_113778/g.207008 Transcript_113778/m.207008 type:complete len:382 (+) Transcript_113778:90-1235(+)